jgi:hypothetical protein
MQYTRDSRKRQPEPSAGGSLARYHFFGSKPSGGGIRRADSPVSASTKTKKVPGTICVQMIHFFFLKDGFLLFRIPVVAGEV